MSAECPKCGSSRVWVGAFPINCDACGWHYLNKYPCQVCNKPSMSAASVNGEAYYGCRDHPATVDMLAKFWNAGQMWP